MVPDTEMLKFQLWKKCTTENHYQIYELTTQYQLINLSQHYISVITCNALNTCSWSRCPIQLAAWSIEPHCINFISCMARVHYVNHTLTSYYACINHSLLPSGSKPKWLYCMYTWIFFHIAMSEWMCRRDQHSRWSGRKATPWPHWTTTTDSRPRCWPVQHWFVRCCSSTPRGWSGQQNVNECNIPLKIWGGNVTQCLLHVGGK